VRKTDNLPPFCAFVTKSGNLNFLEPSEPVQVCNGTDLPLPLHLLYLYLYLRGEGYLFSSEADATCHTLCEIPVFSKDLHWNLFRSRLIRPHSPILFISNLFNIFIPSTFRIFRIFFFLLVSQLIFVMSFCPYSYATRGPHK
jgi:hypothetical protein